MNVGWDDLFPEPVPARRRLVTRRRLLYAAIGAAIATGVGSGAWLATYEPLRPSPGLVSAELGTLRPTIVRAVPGSEGKDVAYVSMDDRGTFVVGFDVGNAGRLPVRIEGLVEAAVDPALITGLLMGAVPSGSRRGSYHGGLVDFEPFTMPAGERRFLALELTLRAEPGCFPAEVQSLPLRYSYLGVFRKEAHLEMPMTASVVCDDRPPPYPPDG